MRFTKAMASRTNDELLAVIRGPAGDWEPEAIEAATAELATRGLDTAAQHPYRGEVQGEDAPPPVPKVPLDDRTRLLAVIFGAALSPLSLLIALATRSTWKKSGDPRDGGELVRFTALGAGISLVLAACLRC